MSWAAAVAAAEPGTRVVIRHRTGETLADIVCACFERRLVAVPLSTRTSDRELTAIVERVSAGIVVDEHGTGAPVRPATDEREHDGLALVMFTSGSTGEPKGVVLDRESALGNATKSAQLHGFAPDRPHATCLPLHHVNALVMSLLGTRATGAELTICVPFDPDEYFARIDVDGVRTASIVPALLHRLVEEQPPWPESLDYLITAAAPLDSDLAARFHRAYGPRLRQGYGLSEAVNFSFVMPLLSDADFREQYVRHRPPVGVPLPETELRLEDGEVLIHSPDRMLGYWDDPASTAKVLDEDGWLRTGDLGELRDGFLVLTGRRTETINRGGVKYHPLDLERQWREEGLPGRFAAVPVRSSTLGQDVGLVLDAGSVASARTLGMVPAAARSGGLPRTETGKPRRIEVGRRLTAWHEGGTRYGRLLDYATRTATAVAASTHRPSTALASRVHAHAVALAATAAPAPSHCGRSAAHDALDALLAGWPDLARGSDGSRLMRAHPGLWKRLMTEWPMGSYAQLMCDVLEINGWLEGRVLELGAGVGNTTTLVAPRVRGAFVWSDHEESLVRRGRWPGAGVRFDFDHTAPPGLGEFDTILATNAIHCAADKLGTLRRLRSMLADGGRLVLAEGANPTTADGQPWALDFLFCAFDGWWDRGGFRTRWEWLALLEQAGFDDLGYSMLRAGEHDLGGVVWGVGHDG